MGIVTMNLKNMMKNIINDIQPLKVKIFWCMIGKIMVKNIEVKVLGFLDTQFYTCSSI